MSLALAIPLRGFPPAKVEETEARSKEYLDLKNKQKIIKVFKWVLFWNRAMCFQIWQLCKHLNKNCAVRILPCLSGKVTLGKSTQGTSFSVKIGSRIGLSGKCLWLQGLCDASCREWPSFFSWLLLRPEKVELRASSWSRAPETSPASSATYPISPVIMNSA